MSRSSPSHYNQLSGAMGATSSSASCMGSDMASGSIRGWGACARWELRGHFQTVKEHVFFFCFVRGSVSQRGRKADGKKQNFNVCSLRVSPVRNAVSDSLLRAKRGFPLNIFRSGCLARPHLCLTGVFPTELSEANSKESICMQYTHSSRKREPFFPDRVRGSC